MHFNCRHLFFYLFSSFMAKAELGRKEEGSNFTVLTILSQILKKKSKTRILKTVLASTFMQKEYM